VSASHLARNSRDQPIRQSSAAERIGVSKPETAEMDLQTVNNDKLFHGLMSSG
jgi:hypothetical protein